MEKRQYSSITLWGFEESHVTPLYICPHKSLAVSQFKPPFEVNELYQFTKIACSFGCNTPIQI